MHFPIEFCSSQNFEYVWWINVYHRVLSCIKHTNSDSKCLKRDRQMCEQFLYTHSMFAWLVCVCVCWSLKSVSMECCAGCCCCCCRCCFFPRSRLFLLPLLQMFAPPRQTAFDKLYFSNPEWEKINYHRRRVLIVKCADHKNRFN